MNDLLNVSCMILGTAARVRVLIGDLEVLVSFYFHFSHTGYRVFIDTKKETKDAWIAFKQS